MDADFSVELGPDDPVLDFPWKDPAGKLAYFDLKRQPELITQLEETQKFPELAEFLRAINSPRSPMQSAKCDAWSTTNLTPEEEIFNATFKFASYVDLVFADANEAEAIRPTVDRAVDRANDRAKIDDAKTPRRQSFPAHEDIAKRLTELLRRAPEMPASVEVIIRRCFFVIAAAPREASNPLEGFYFSLYVNGYGKDESTACRQWTVALKLAANAITQVSAKSGPDPKKAYKPLSKKYFTKKRKCRPQSESTPPL
ncbi:MAG: hypothetical protein WBQ72_05430 [Terriglobales bacterium]|jgi:hypothetical protein